MMCQRAVQRKPFGKPLSEQGVIQQWIADSRVEIEMLRLLTLQAAWKMDTLGKKAARDDIAMIKIAAPEVHTTVLNRAIQLFGAAGVSDDFPLAEQWVYGRTLHLADGPDEVHKRSLARAEIKRWTQAV
jgi:acyl-CoA dehydrogenase